MIIVSFLQMILMSYCCISQLESLINRMAFRLLPYDEGVVMFNHFSNGGQKGLLASVKVIFGFDRHVKGFPLAKDCIGKL